MGVEGEEGGRWAKGEAPTVNTERTDRRNAERRTLNVERRSYRAAASYQSCPELGCPSVAFIAAFAPPPLSRSRGTTACRGLRALCCDAGVVPSVGTDIMAETAVMRDAVYGWRGSDARVWARASEEY